MECFALDLKGATHFRGVVTNFSTYFTFIKAWAMTTWLNKEDTMLDFGNLHTHAILVPFQWEVYFIPKRVAVLPWCDTVARFLTEWNSSCGTVTRSGMTLFGGIIYGKMRPGRDSLGDKSCPETCRQQQWTCLGTCHLNTPLQSTDLVKRNLCVIFPFSQVDTREPDVMRIAPTPLYNSFTDVYRFVTLLGEVFNTLKLKE